MVNIVPYRCIKPNPTITLTRPKTKRGYLAKFKPNPTLLTLNLTLTVNTNTNEAKD